MERIIELEGVDLARDRLHIEQTAAGTPTYILMREDMRLGEYLDRLCWEGLPSGIMSGMRICQDFLFDGPVLFQTKEDPARMVPLRGMRHLLARAGQPCRICVADDSRDRLARILQQLVYIRYPLDQVELWLKTDELDARRADQLLKRNGSLGEEAREALAALEAIDVSGSGIPDVERKELLESRAQAMKACEDLLRELDEAAGSQVCLAICGSPRAGKGTLANGLMGVRLVPDYPLGSADGMRVYQTSEDGAYHLRISQTRQEPPERWHEVMRTPDPQDVRALTWQLLREAREEGSSLGMEASHPELARGLERSMLRNASAPGSIARWSRAGARGVLRKSDVALYVLDASRPLCQEDARRIQDATRLLSSGRRFPSLLVVANKVDLALGTPGTAPSAVRVLDGIRREMETLTEGSFQDFVVFATSALEYQNALALREAAGAFPEEMGHLLRDDARLEDQIHPVVRDLRKDDATGEIVRALSCLRARCVWLEDILGSVGISLSAIEEDSGMPYFVACLARVLDARKRGGVPGEMKAMRARLEALALVQEKICRISGACEE